MFEKFREMELEGWSGHAGHYGDYTARLTTQAIPALLGAVRTRVDLQLLDICTGPGYAAGAAAAIGARADGVDFAPEMVRVAQAAFPACRFFEGDALALDVPDASYDAAVCPFGVFHFTEPERAFAEARRILRPGGRYAFSQWCAPAEAPFFRTVFGVLAELADMSRVDPAPDAFRFSDRDRCRSALADAGFEDIAIAEVPSRLDAPGGEIYDFLMHFSVRMPIVLNTQTPETVQAIRQGIEDAMTEYSVGDRVVVDCPSFVVSGRVPE